MSLFSRPSTVLWPQAETTHFYFDRSDSNTTTFDFSLWSELTTANITSLATFLVQNKISSPTILVPDDYLLTRSFTYDSVISHIDQAEVVSLAQNFISFKINPEYLTYELISQENRTLIKTQIFDHHKLKHLVENIAKIGLQSYSFVSVSQAIAPIIASFCPTPQFFLLYPLNQFESTLLLSQGSDVYLTTTIKHASLEIQKTVNYSKLYFSSPVTKIYLPEDKSTITSTTTLDKTIYSEPQIATNFKKPSNLPLPVLGVFLHPPKTAIINSSTNYSSPPPMENKKNIFPLIAVFVATAAIASIIIWFVLNRNAADLQTPGGEEPTPTIEEAIPTDMPTPTAETTPVTVSKKLKLQVLNGTSINGQAALLKEKLTKLGFTSVAVGNSPETITANKIRVKAKQSANAQSIITSLAGYFDATIVEDLTSTASYDVVFIIGTDLSSASDPTLEDTVTISPTKKPSPTPTE